MSFITVQLIQSRKTVQLVNISHSNSPLNVEKMSSASGAKPPMPLDPTAVTAPDPL